MPVTPSCHALRNAQDFEEVLGILETHAPEFDGDLTISTRTQYLQRLRKFCKAFAHPEEALTVYQQFGSGIANRKQDIKNFCRTHFNDRHYQCALLRLDRAFGFQPFSKISPPPLPSWKGRRSRSYGIARLSSVAKTRPDAETHALAASSSSTAPNTPTHSQTPYIRFQEEIQQLMSRLISLKNVHLQTRPIFLGGVALSLAERRWIHEAALAAEQAGGNPYDFIEGLCRIEPLDGHGFFAVQQSSSNSFIQKLQKLSRSRDFLTMPHAASPVEISDLSEAVPASLELDGVSLTADDTEETTPLNAEAFVNFDASMAGWISDDEELVVEDARNNLYL